MLTTEQNITVNVNEYISNENKECEIVNNIHDVLDIDRAVEDNITESDFFTKDQLMDMLVDEIVSNKLLMNLLVEKITNQLIKDPKLLGKKLEFSNNLNAVDFENQVNILMYVCLN